MTIAAGSTGIAVLAWIELAIGLALAVVALALLHSVLRPLLEIRRYADDILTAGVGIATNLDRLDELAHTQELAAALPGFAVAYLEKLEGSA